MQVYKNVYQTKKAYLIETFKVVVLNGGAGDAINQDTTRLEPISTIRTKFDFSKDQI